jgi:hypothetical protein
VNFFPTNEWNIVWTTAQDGENRGIEGPFSFRGETQCGFGRLVELGGHPKRQSELVRMRRLLFDRGRFFREDKMSVHFGDYFVRGSRFIFS